MLKTKLFILTICIISLSLLMSGIVYYKNINSIFQDQSILKVDHDIKMFNLFIKDTKEQIKNLAVKISNNEDIKSSLNLISNYEDPKNYTKEIFDYEKETLINLSKQWINLNDNFSLSLYDKNKKLILINRKIAKVESIGYVSYDKNSQVYFVDKKDPKNKNIPIHEFMALNDTNKFESNYKDNSYTLIYFKPVKIDDMLIGYAKICFTIDQTSIINIKERFVNNFVLEINDLEYILNGTIKTNEFINIKQSKDYLLKKRLIIEDTNTPLNFISIIDKTDINDKLDKLLNSIVFIWIGILIVSLYLSFLFMDKYILNPIKELQKSIRKIRNNKIPKSINKHIKTTTKDEIKIISEEFNALANELNKNIAFLEGYKNVMDEGSIVSKSDLDGNIIYVNDNFIKISGYTEEEILGAPHNIIRHPDTPKATFKKIWKTLRSNKVWKGILKNRKKDGSYYWVDTVIRPIFNENKEVCEYIAVRHDITELIEQRETINKMVNTDSLTQLNSRFKLINDIHKIKKPMLSFLNIDNFRQINDFYGHAFGDILIKEIALLLISQIKEYKKLKLYRTQADEFAILSSLDKEDEKDDFYIKISNILNIVNNKNLDIQNEEISVNLTAAISFEDKDNILPTANMALRRAKKQNIDLSVYKEEFSLDKIYANNIKWTKKLKSAIQEDRIVPYFQAIVNNKTGKFEKYESLMRLIDEDEKVISPFFFLDIAKKTKHYTELTKIMIKKSFEMFKDKDVEFSINLTIDDILNNDIKKYIFTMLQQYNIQKCVVFEIVESESIENFEKVSEFIQDVKYYGCKIAIDDFGTGYSNFEYLMKLKADYIKIDGSMIKNIHTDENARMVVSVIVDFAQKMNMKTIAEYVENEEVLKVVKELEIDYSQGYYYSEPKDSI